MRFTRKKKIQYPGDIKKIRAYLDMAGNLEATDEEIDAAWAKFSDECFSAGWMYVDDEILPRFTDWLERELESCLEVSNVGDNELDIAAIIFHEKGENMFSCWNNLFFDEDDAAELTSILDKYRNTGCSVTGNSTDIAEEIKSLL